ncbi:MAG: PaaI family thioesterase [Pelomonas sp.]|nr:PaaI family thioesterase [Roseateles sp.]
MEFPVHIPFVEALGFELVRLGAGEAELAVALRPEQLNAWSVAHGGLVMTLLDVAMAHAARSRGESVVDMDRGVVTIEMKTSFMRPGEGRLVATGRLLERTTTMAFCEGAVRNAAGELCAHATGSFKFLKALPTGRSIKPLRGPASD